jgi:hypothetical protein
VTVGTVLRFCADAIVLTLAVVIGTIPGTVVATSMMVVGVVTEAIYVGLKVRPVLRYDLRRVPSLQDKILLRDLVTFFIPLGMTPLLQQLIRPIGSAALSRMANPLETLAIWPVVASFTFLIVTPGAAYNEVVIAMLDRPGARPTLKRFMFFLIGAQLTLMLLLALTPLAYIWFSRVSGLPQDLALLASQAFLLFIPSSIISPLNSWFSGTLLHIRKSRALTEGMVIYLVVYTVTLWTSRALVDASGIYIAVGSAMLASITQTMWLAFRAQAAGKGPGQPRASTAQ